ncbi:MAG: ABC transporter permease [Anaerolineaceae bacterium]|nr:ABC transporter permease [Anaerolineaceae bacterium]
MRSISARSFTIGAWLGWQIESNWTDPFLFAVYSIVKPLAGAGILVAMYSVITGGDFASPIFAYIYIGNAFYQYVASVLTGVSWAVIDDREHYKTLKYIYVAPVTIPVYLVGRGFARILTGSLSVVITLLAGVWLLNLRIDWAAVNWLLFGTTLLVGIAMLTTMGLLLAGLTLLLANHNFFLGDAVAGALYLFSGAIFPLEVLPRFLRPIGYFIPISYWLELLRRALVGSVAAAFPTFTALSDLNLLFILVGLSLLFGSLSLWVFRFCERLARERGLIDYVTNY